MCGKTLLRGRLDPQIQPLTIADVDYEATNTSLCEDDDVLNVHSPVWAGAWWAPVCPFLNKW
jgi:hypothetical protein